MNSFLKQNFVGKDGFVWWIGQIAPEENWTDNYGKTPNVGIGTTIKVAWGQRCKVRIMGYHPYSTAELEDKDLPWAQVLTHAGNSGSHNTAETVRLTQGDVVIGFFLDGHNAQVPMILGTFANTKQWADLKTLWKKDGAPATPFGIFGGYDQAFGDASNYAINKSSSNDNTAESALSNFQITEDQKNQRQQNDPVNEIHTTDSITGEIINLCDTGATDGIKNDVLGLVRNVQNLRGQINFGNEFFRDQVKGLVSSTTESVVRRSGSLVSGMVDHAFNKIIPIGQTGLGVLYKGVFSKIVAATGNPAIAHIAGVAAQTAMLGPLNKAENLIGCLPNKIIADLGEMTESILNSVVDNVFNFTDCIGDQTVGAITNGIIDKVGAGMAGSLGGLEKILGFFNKGGFDIENIIRASGGDGIAGQVGLRGCTEPVVRDELGPCRYRLGYGPISSSPKNLDKLVKDANIAAAISAQARLAGFPLDGIQDIAGALDIFNSDMKNPGYKSSISDCYSGLPTVCEPPKIKIFGGGGSGAEAIPIFGNIVGTGSNRTGSIIDIKMTNPGNNYQFPPFVEIVDNCDQGIGGQARATVKDGKVNIYVLSEGENYPVGDQPEMAVVDVNIINPGSGYDDADTVTDNIGNEYDVTVQGGAIVKVKPTTTIGVEEVVELRVNSRSGRDALMFAVIDERPEYQGVVKQQIDCIAPRTGNLVGYVKGKPYYGDFHVHPNTGKKMVGAAHTTTPHEVIYDTPQESL